MSKSILTKILSSLIIAAAPVLWLLSIIMPETFAWFNLGYAVAIISGGFAMLLIFNSLLSKKSVTQKKLNIILASLLALITLLSIASAITMPDELLWPIILIIISAFILISVLVTGGKNWDAGDNQTAGYKTYHQRKKDNEEQ